MGRPWKYDKLIEGLDDDELYTTSCVVRKGREDGFFDHSLDYPDQRLSEPEIHYAMKKAASSLAHFASRLPAAPEGHMPTNNRRSLHPAWYGRTWKAKLNERKD